MKYNHFAYMRSIAEKYKAFGHIEGKRTAYATATGIAGLEGFVHQSRDIAGGCLVALDQSDWVEEENDMGALWQNHNFSYAVLYPVAEGDLEELEAAQAWCNEKAKNIAHRLRYDSKMGNAMQRNGVSGQVVFTKLGRLGDFWGVLASFSMVETTNGCWEKEEWSEG
ncbi:MAG: hypothetical protein ACRC9X_06445 [Bacteroidales bacterium]